MSMLMMECCVCYQERKKIKLYHPKYFHQLYPNKLGSKGRTVQSQINCDSPDYTKFPLFSEVVCEEGELRSGDILFIPGFYWHQVTSVESSISINIFFGDKGDSHYIEKLIKDRMEPFLYWLLNILEQNSDIFETELLPELEDIIRVFLKYQFKENSTDEQIQCIVSKILQHYHITDRPLFQGQKRRNPKRLKIRGLLFRDD